MSNHPLTDDQRRFIQDMAALLVPWGMPPGMANLYAWLLLTAEPASLDTIAAQLGMAKSSASVAARGLEQIGLARRHTEPGSKRLRYGASDIRAFCSRRRACSRKSAGWRKPAPRR